MSVNLQTGGGKNEGAGIKLRVYYTAKNINATAGSRSAINDNLTVGDFVVQDPYGHDKGANVIHVTQPQTSFLAGPKYVVTGVHSSVNEIPDSSAATQRRGGFITVMKCADAVNASVGAITAGQRIIVTNGSFDGSASTGTDITVAVAFDFAGVARATQTATGVISVAMKP